LLLVGLTRSLIESDKSDPGIAQLYRVTHQDYSSAPPAQRDGAAHRMPEFAAILFHLQHGVFQTEVPLGGAIGVVDQH
jgi:hypothetical protein